MEYDDYNIKYDELYEIADSLRNKYENHKKLFDEEIAKPKLKIKQGIIGIDVLQNINKIGELQS